MGYNDGHMLERLKQQTLDTVLPYILVIGGFVGLVSSFILTLEKIALLKDPAHQLSCSINPVLSCGSIIMSDQASAFVFPNPILGLIGFSAVITVGMGLLAGATYKRWFWRGLGLGSLFGVVFVHWLIYESLYAIGALCLYCMVVWTVTWPIFWYTTLYNLRKKHLPTPRSLRGVVEFLQQHHADILVAWYIIIIGLIIHNFWYYWSTLL